MFLKYLSKTFPYVFFLMFFMYALMFNQKIFVGNQLYLFIIFIFSLGYVFGGIPFGLIFGKFWGINDVRKTGSKVIGATNVLREVGKIPAVLTLICDFLKGLFPGILTKKLILFFNLSDEINHFGALNNLLINEENFIFMSGLGAIIGHIFPSFLNFSGGKGVATAAGVYFPFAPTSIISTLVWFFSLIITKLSSLSSILGFAIMPPFIVFFTNKNLFLLSFLVSILIIFTHRKNIKNLIKKEEKKIF